MHDMSLVCVYHCTNLAIGTNKTCSWKCELYNDRSILFFAIHHYMILYICLRVIDGWDTLDDLEKVPVHEKTFKPTTDICIRRVTIHANPLAD